jgi:hypothetical protein
MTHYTRLSSMLLAPLLVSAAALAQEAGTASGKGTIERLVPGATAAAQDAKSEAVPFVPRFSYAYHEGKGEDAATWIVLTEKQPPLKAWLAAKDQSEARRLWCGAEKTSFVALKLDAKNEVDLYFLCPANGGVNTEMLNTANGLKSIDVKYQTKDKRMKGTLKTGQGSCPGPNGSQVYCTPTGDYAFDAPVVK